MLTAKERWTRLDSKRSAVLKRARAVSALTIPALLPPEGHTDNNDLPTPFQSLGARGVNNIASKLLLALMPPGTPFFKLQMEPATRAQYSDASAVTDMEGALAQLEQVVSRKVESSSMRPTLFEVFKHLVVGGNVLAHFVKGVLRMFRLDQYCVSRSKDGKPIEVVIKECVHPLSLSPEVRAACDVDLGKDNEKKDNPVDVYTVIEWSGTRYREWQEIHDKLVPNADGDGPADKCPWLPLRWQAVPGQDYGRGLGEEYLGDLTSLEGIAESIVRFAAAAAKILFLVKPNSSTSWKDIVDAVSGDAIVGSVEDVDTLQLEKFADFQVAKSVYDDLTVRLSHAFLLRSGTIRDAERVTQEEIRYIAQELEDVLGGVYTVQGQELQQPLVVLIMADMMRNNEMRALPEGAVDPVIVTGFEALGRNHAVNKLRAWLADLATVDPQLSTIRKEKVAKRLGVGYGVEDLDELIKTSEELAEEQQQMMGAAIAEKAVGPMAGAAAKAATSAAQQ
jgi:hypothetical protein